MSVATSDMACATTYWRRLGSHFVVGKVELSYPCLSRASPPSVLRHRDRLGHSTSRSCRLCAATTLSEGMRACLAAQADGVPLAATPTRLNWTGRGAVVASAAPNPRLLRLRDPVLWGGPTLAASDR